MLLTFENQILDTDRRELRRDGEFIAVEPQVLDLLVYLIGNRDRVVTKDDLIDAIWNGRIVSESTLTSRISKARNAIGDNGIDQRLICTISKRGFRFVASVREDGSDKATNLAATVEFGAETGASGIPAEELKGVTRPEFQRASLAVMPFVDLSTDARVPGGPAEALARDVITRLVKLRTMFVIAPGTTFALRDQGIGAAEAARLLKVDYLVSGSLRQSGARLTVMVSLTETLTSRVLWAENFDRTTADAFTILDEIGNSIVATVESEIDAFERNRAILKPPNSLTAWEAYHRGMWHSYRMTVTDNSLAQHYLEKAINLDPTFARAYAALSFTHFQNAFQPWIESGAHIQQAIELAYATADKGVTADQRDPSAHWALGRALWLRGNIEGAISGLKHAVSLGPSFAYGHYGLAFAQALTGDPLAGIASADQSERLSPFDPILFGVYSARAIALARLGRYEEAADWASRSASFHNASLQAHAIAGYCLALADRRASARAHLALVHSKHPNFQIDSFLKSMRFSSETQHLFSKAAIGLGRD